MNADYSMRLTDLRWFVVMVKSRHEKSAAEMLLAQGLSHFLPLHRECVSGVIAARWLRCRSLTDIYLSG